jgi:hypothetical protein
MQVIEIRWCEEFGEWLWNLREDDDPEVDGGGFPDVMDDPTTPLDALKSLVPESYRHLPVKFFRSNDAGAPECFE